MNLRSFHGRGDRKERGGEKAAWTLVLTVETS